MTTLRRNRLILWSVLGAVLFAGLVFAFSPRPVEADLATVERGGMMVTINEEGETRIRDVYVVSSPILGRVARIESDPGDEVTAGETALASITPVDPTPLDVRTQAEREAAVKAAEAALALTVADVDRTKAERDFARADLRRAEGLEPGSTISERALQRARIDVTAAGAAYASAIAARDMRQADLETARAALIAPDPENAAARAEGGEGLCCVAVHAPVSGKVLRVLHESEGVIAAGAPLLEIGDPVNLEIVVDLLSEDAVRVTEGDPVLIGAWGGEQDLNGRVRRVEPYGFTKVSALGIEEQRVNVVIDFESPAEAWARLGHGFRVEARIVNWRSDEALTAPLSALFREGEDWAVFAVENGRARVRKLTLGRMNGVEAEVLEGLEDGATVVTHPGSKVQDGVRVARRPAA